MELIQIHSNIFQYPTNVVYVRESYKKLWEYFEKTMNYRKFERKNLCSDELNELKDYLEEINKRTLSYPYLFLLRGNPGLGKTSFIIYLLCKLREYSKKEYNIVFMKNVNKSKVNYVLTKEGTLKETADTDLPKLLDCVISDSYDYNIMESGKYHNLVIFISSPDVKNYSCYNKYIYKLDKQDLYLDVFSKSEINEWMEYCLTKRLKNYITENKLDERYGGIPRHIYFAAIYGEYFRKSYWDDIYTKAINTVIGNYGFADFIEKYLVPYKEKNESSPSEGVFDITLSHCIVKYLLEIDKTNKDNAKAWKLSAEEMRFISNDVEIGRAHV